MLSELIERAYEIFSSYRAELPLCVCTECCMTPKETQTLASLPVKSIPQELLANYNDSARTEKTEINEVKHFLPRYLELISTLNFPSHSSEIALKILAPFDKREWKKHELEILENFQHSFFNHYISIYPIPAIGENIDSFIVMFWKSGLDINLILDTWTKK